MKSAVILFAKEPRAGQVKTRLCPPLTAQRAARVYAALLETLVERLAAVGGSAPVERVLAHHPPSARDYFRLLGEPRGYRVEAQRGRDLLERMENAYAAAFQRGADFALIVGTDVPGLGPEHVQRALVVARDADVVQGPDGTGGCWLVGHHRDAPSPLRRAREGSADFREVVLATCAEDDLRVAELPALVDVDTAADLRAFRQQRPRTAAPIRRVFPGRSVS